MYSIEIHSNVYTKWRMWIDWMKSDVIEFSRYCMDQYPEIVSMDHPGGSMFPQYRTFVFESESYYHWFLLRAR